VYLHVHVYAHARTHMHGLIPARSALQDTCGGEHAQPNYSLPPRLETVHGDLAGLEGPSEPPCWCAALACVHDHAHVHVVCMLTGWVSQTSCDVLVGTPLASRRACAPCVHAYGYSRGCARACLLRPYAHAGTIS